jgi:Methyltransferase domain
VSAVATPPVTARLRRRVARALPRPAWEAQWRLRYRARWGFMPPPIWSDWSGYERLLEAFVRHGVAEVPGDVVEVGVLLGGGTYKLCRYFEAAAPDKRVYAIDVFDPTFDVAVSAGGPVMADLYLDALAGRDQRSVFDDVTRGCANLQVLAEDSAKVRLPAERLAFAYVDGNHTAPYVRSDFELVWPRLSPGGIVAFHDYAVDHPAVTHTLHAVIGEHADEIGKLWVDDRIIFLQRRT